MWTWTYSYTSLLGAYTAKLTAEESGSDVLWKMYVSKAGLFDNFLWYEGVSALDGSGGTWSLNFSPLDPKSYITIVWSQGSDGVAEIKYTNAIPGEAGNGSYITYGMNNNTPHNRFYDIYNIEQTNLTEIDWNSLTSEGQVKDPDHFSDSDTHCWDEMLQDTSCN